MASDVVHKRFLTGVLYLMLAVLACCFIAASLVCYVTDSEIWSVASAANFFTNFFDFGLLAKPLFHFGLFIFTRFDAHWNDFILVRLFFAMNGLVLVGLTYLLTWQISKSRFWGLLAALLLLSTTFFMARGFRIRSDLVATTVLLLQLWLYRRLMPGCSSTSSCTSTPSCTGTSGCTSTPSCTGTSSNIGGHVGIGSIVVVSLLSFIMLALTPKIIFCWLCCLPLVCVWLRDRRELLVKIAFVHLIIALFLLGTILLILPYEKLAANLWHTWDYFIHTFTAAGFAMHLLSWRRFIYVGRFFQENPHFLVVFMFSVGSVLVSIFERKLPFKFLTKWQLPALTGNKEETQALLFTCSLIFGLMLIYPEKLPFFITALLPIPAIVAVLMVKCLFQYLIDRLMFKSGYFIMYTLIFVTSVAAGTKVLAIMLHNRQAEQIFAITELTKYLAPFPEAKIFDSVGAIASHKLLPLYIGPGEYQEKYAIVDEIVKNEVDIVLYTSKMRTLEPPLSNMLKTNYIATANNQIFLRSVTLPLAEVLQSDSVNHRSNIKVSNVNAAPVINVSASPISNVSTSPVSNTSAGMLILNSNAIIQILKSRFGKHFDVGSQLLLLLQDQERRVITNNQFLLSSDFAVSDELVMVPVARLTDLSAILTVPSQARYFKITVFPYPHFAEGLDLTKVFGYDSWL